MQKTNKELISIIVPVYKVEKYLDRCVESLLNQNYKNVEVILVDDGSPDSSPEICDKWAEKDNRVKVIHKPNGGVSSARNEGLKVAKGEYICFCDSDDEVLPNYCEDLLKALIENDADMAVGTTVNVCGNTKLKIKEIKKDFTCNLENPKDFYKFLKKAHYEGPANKIYKKEKIKELFDVKVNFGEDLLFILEYLKNCKKVVVINKTVYLYYTNPNSLTSLGNLDKYKKVLNIYERRRNLCLHFLKNKKWASFFSGGQFFEATFYTLKYMYDKNYTKKQIKEKLIEINSDETTQLLYKEFKPRTLRTFILFNCIRKNKIGLMFFLSDIKRLLNKITRKHK